jgi:hypothetical protein
MKTPDSQTAALELTGGRGSDHILEITGGDNVRRYPGDRARRPDIDDRPA